MAEDGLSNVINQVRRYTEFARRVLRRWWIILPFFVLGAGGSVFYALVTSRIYQSRALVSWKRAFQREDIGMEGGTHLPENFLYHKLSQLLASDTLILKTARTHDLYPGLRASAAPEVILEIVRKAISFGIVGNDSFWIAFEYTDPLLAQRSNTTLVEEFIQQHVRDKTRAAEGTQRFMEQEAAKVKQQVEAIEGALAKFRADHPEMQVDPLTGLPRIVQPSAPGRGPSSARIRYLVARNPDLQESLRRKGQLEAQLLELSPRSDPRLARATEDHSNAQANLSSLLRRYSEEHPDVQRASRIVQQMAQQLEAAKKLHESRSAEVRRQLREEDGNISELSRAPRRRVVVSPAPGEPSPATQEDEGSPDLAGTAQLEKQWYELTGERTVITAKYQQIETQLQRSKLGASMEQKQAEKEFTVVDPPSLPGKPIRPSRKKIVMAGTALGLLLGLGLASMLVLFDPRIYNEDDLKRACNLPVLAQIPRDV